MAEHLLLVFTAAQPGQEEEYHRWYDQQHLDEILALPGFVSASRYDNVAGPDSSTEQPTQNLAIYEIEGDPVAAVAALRAARPTLDISPALTGAPGVWLFSARQACPPSAVSR